MSPHINISAGELFDLIRPAVLVLAALISTLVFASARKHFSFFIALFWALATFFLPLIVLPLYLIALLISRQTPSRPVRWKLIGPLIYGLLIMSGIGLYLYKQGRGVDVHLARAAHAKIRGNRSKTIAEYKAALRVEDDPHTRKLLGFELFDAGNWTEALSELRLAEQGGEPDDLMILRIAGLLDVLNQPAQARLEYQRFLESSLCVHPVPDKRCELARNRVAQESSNIR